MDGEPRRKRNGPRMAMRRNAGGILGPDLLGAYSELHDDRTSESLFIVAVRGLGPFDRAEALPYGDMSPLFRRIKQHTHAAQAT
jgi:hypothetical protein